MSCKTYVFRARIVRASGRKLGIYIPKEVEKALERYHGREVTVVLYVPEEGV